MMLIITLCNQKIYGLVHGIPAQGQYYTNVTTLLPGQCWPLQSRDCTFSPRQNRSPFG